MLNAGFEMWSLRHPQNRMPLLMPLIQPRSASATVKIKVVSDGTCGRITHWMVFPGAPIQLRKVMVSLWSIRRIACTLNASIQCAAWLVISWSICACTVSRDMASHTRVNVSRNASPNLQVQRVTPEVHRSFLTHDTPRDTSSVPSHFVSPLKPTPKRE